MARVELHCSLYQGTRPFSLAELKENLLIINYLLISQLYPCIYFYLTIFVYEINIININNIDKLLRCAMLSDSHESNKCNFYFTIVFYNEA